MNTTTHRDASAPARRRSWRRAGLVAIAGLAAVGMPGTATARPTCGDTVSCQPSPGAKGTVNVADGYTLTVRKRPNSSAKAVRKLKDGASVRIICQTQGENVTGTYGTSTLWNKLARGGYVSDTYIFTGSDGRVAPDCGGKKPPKNNGGGKGRPASVQLKDDYPYPNASWNGVDPWAFYYRECTSFVAYRLNKVMSFHNTMKGGRFSNAHNWDENAKAIGMKVNRTPKVGSVMVRNSGTYGHVAIVAKVSKNKKKIFVEQYNAGGTHNYSKEWLTKTSVMTFIHPKG